MPSFSFRAIGSRLKHIALLCGLISITSVPVIAHERWADGSPIPAWVGQYCCSVADAHQLTVSQIYRVEGGWRAAGYNHLIPDDRVLPSQDGYVWLFYRTLDDGYQSTVTCFFVPQGSI